MRGPFEAVVRRRHSAVLAAVTTAFLSCVAAASAAPSVGDGRSFELISGGLESGRNVKQVPPIVNPGADRLLFEIDSAQSDSGAARERIYRVANRSVSGWSSVDVNPPSTERATVYDDYAASSPTVDRLLIEGRGFDGTASPFTGTFAIDPATRAVQLLSSGNGNYVANSRSTEVLYFQSDQDLAPGADQFPDDVLKIYRADATGIHLASDLPSADFEDGFTTPITALREGEALGGGLQRDTIFDTEDFFDSGDNVTMPLAGGRRHVVSVDGSRLYFRAGTKATRVDDNGQLAQPRTANGQTLLPLWLADGDAGAVPVSASQRTGEVGALRRAQFIGASPDGGTVFFVAGDPLKNGEQGGGIYRYVRSGNSLTRLTGNLTTPDFSGLGVSSAWTSDDATAVFFVATAKLRPEATAGARNAYVWRNGTLTFAGDLGTDGRVERVSRDGAYAVFSSSRGIGGSATGGLVQLFRYRSSDGELRCASCRADGSPNAGRGAVDFRPGFGVGASDRVAANVISPRNLSDDGHVFFTSLDRLVAQDQSQLPDVYEFADGGVRLLSGGQGASALVDNTDDGRSVFMVSTAALTGADNDAGDYDLYVRRAGGGFPDPPSAPLPCSGDGCQAPPTVAATLPTPGSDRVGAGNARRAVKPALLAAPAITTAARDALARGAPATVAVRLRGSGRLTITLTARVGGSRRVVASGTSRIGGGGQRTARVRLRLSRAGLRQLRRDGVLRVTATAAITGASRRSTVLTLRRKGR